MVKWNKVVYRGRNTACCFWNRGQFYILTSGLDRLQFIVVLPQVGNNGWKPEARCSHSDWRYEFTPFVHFSRVVRRCTGNPTVVSIHKSQFTVHAMCLWFRPQNSCSIGPKKEPSCSCDHIFSTAFWFKILWMPASLDITKQREK